MRFLVLVFCLIPALVYPQIVIDFESGVPDNWVRDTTCWGVDNQIPIAGLYSLKHKKDRQQSARDIAYLPLQSLQIDRGASWKFKLRHGYNPSSSNKWSLVLASDEIPDKDISGSTANGIVLGVNLSGYDDTLRLWKLNEGVSEVLVSTNLNWQNDVGTEAAPELIIERDSLGGWEVSIKIEGQNPQVIGTGMDNTLFASAYFGICYSYTSSCDQLLWLDDICIDGFFEEDNENPEISYAEFIDFSSLRVFFNEPLDTRQLAGDNFLVSPGGIKPVSISFVDASTIDMEFDAPFNNKARYSLSAFGICDISENCANCQPFEIALAFPEWGDIIITEFMPDPDPSLGLSSMEYIELFNRSLFPINLRTLSFVRGDKICSFPDCVLKPGEYIIVCDENDTVLVNDELPCAGIKSLPALNNRSDYFILCDAITGTVSGVEYDDGWFNNHFKNEGGWSFELIDLSLPFAGASNWTFSTDNSGGTPGRQNSINDEKTDISEPYITNSFACSPSYVKIDFSEPVCDLSSNPGKVTIDGTIIDELIKLDSLRRSFAIILSEELSPDKIYTAYFDDVDDYAGNSLNPAYCQMGLTSKPGRFDIIINEVLFDPLPGEPEFIEFYNRSDKVLDASRLIVTCINLQSGDTGTVSCLSPGPRGILPGEYYVICEDKNALSNAFFHSNPRSIFEPGNLPVLPGDKGRILLLRNDLFLLDDFSYYDDYHNDMLSSTKGVSLERISPEVSGNNQSNWLSATGLSGWATPGVKNSVFNRTESLELSSLALSSSRISPDNDGFEDYLLIQFSLDEAEWLVDVRVYDDMGYLVNKLCENLSAYGQETLIWKGTDSKGNKLPAGIYIVFVEAVSSKGEVCRWKEVCSILRR